MKQTIVLRRLIYFQIRCKFTTRYVVPAHACHSGMSGSNYFHYLAPFASQFVEKVWEIRIVFDWLGARYPLMEEFGSGERK